MRKIILYIASSIDYRIAREDGDTTWLHAPEYALANEDYGYSELLQRTDTTLMGSKTYDMIMGFDIPFPYPDTTNYVFTRSEDRKDTVHVQFVNKDIVSFIKDLRSRPGKDIWLIGGSQINTVLFNAGFIDEVILTIMPQTLGAGIPLFAPGLNASKLKLDSSTAWENGVVQLRYQRAHVQ